MPLHLPLSHCPGKCCPLWAEKEPEGSEAWEGFEDEKEGQRQAQPVQQTTPGFLVDEPDKGPSQVLNSRQEERGYSQDIWT